MTAVALNQFLVLYTWFLLAALMLFMLLIARFYQNFSGERTYFRLFLLPVVLFGIAAVRYTSLQLVAHEMIADLLIAIGGFILLGLSIRLYWLMIYRQRQPESEDDEANERV